MRTKDFTDAGWEFVHVSIDDGSRVSFTEIHPSEGEATVIAHPRVLTDNGPCYRSQAFVQAVLCSVSSPALHAPARRDLPRWLHH